MLQVALHLYLILLSNLLDISTISALLQPWFREG
jgi:hypothetical protein